MLLIVSEPPPTQLGEGAITGKTKKECEKLINEKIKFPLANNQIPYHIWILDQYRFEKYWNGFLKEVPIIKLVQRGGKKPYRGLSFRELNRIVPEALYNLTMDEILNGNIVDILLKLIDNE